MKCLFLEAEQTLKPKYLQPPSQDRPDRHCEVYHTFCFLGVLCDGFIFSLLEILTCSVEFSKSLTQGTFFLLESSFALPPVLISWGRLYNLAFLKATCCIHNIYPQIFLEIVNVEILYSIWNITEIGEIFEMILYGSEYTRAPGQEIYQKKEQEM